MRRALWIALALAAGCAGENLTPSPATLSPTPTPPPACVPNLDGVIDASEMQPALGVPAHFDVTTGDTAVDLQSWNWSGAWPATAGFDLEGVGLSAKWYAASFPGGQFAAPIDAADTTEGVYAADDTALWLLGLASTAQSPKTLLVYQQPIALYRFPLHVGESWTSTGTVVNGTFDGVPYAGYDTYDVSVDASGELVLPDFTFTQVLRVRTDVTVQPAVGVISTRKLVSYLFECYGEVARATSRLDETQDDFTTASEVRRLALPPNGGHT